MVSFPQNKCTQAKEVIPMALDCLRVCESHSWHLAVTHYKTANHILHTNSSFLSETCFFGKNWQYYHLLWKKPCEVLIAGGISDKFVLQFPYKEPSENAKPILRVEQLCNASCLQQKLTVVSFRRAALLSHTAPHSQLLTDINCGWQLI